MNNLIITKENILFGAALFAVIFISTWLLVGCAKGSMAESAKELPVGTMLIDYYHAQKATVGADGYFEMVLYATDSKDLLKLSVYRKSADDTDETCTEYLVPYKAAERCYEIIKMHRLHRWNNIKDAVSTDGSLTVCKYYSNGEYVRVSTDQMSDNGQKILDMIGDIMSEYVNADNAISNTDAEVEL